MELIRDKVISNFSASDGFFVQRYEGNDLLKPVVSEDFGGIGSTGFVQTMPEFDIGTHKNLYNKRSVKKKMPLTMQKMPRVEDCLVYASTVQGSTIRGLLETLKDVVYESCFKFTKQGIKLVTLDSSRKSLVYLHLEAPSFDKYICNEELVAGVNLSSFTKLLKSVSKNIVTIFIERHDPYKLGLIVENVEKKRVSLFKVPILDIEFSDLKTPEVSHDTKIQIQSVDFQKLCRELITLGDIVEIQTDGINISFSAGSETGPGQVTEFCQNSDDDDSDFDGDDDNFIKRKRQRMQPFCEKYELKYLSLFSKSSALSTFVDISMSENKPLVLKYQVGNLGVLIFMVSPLEV